MRSHWSIEVERDADELEVELEVERVVELDRCYTEVRKIVRIENSVFAYTA